MDCGGVLVGVSEFVCCIFLLVWFCRWLVVVVLFCGGVCLVCLYW